MGITGAAKLLDVPVVGLPESAGGLRASQVRAVAARERAAGRNPRACYVVPDVSNPSGTTLSLADRRELLAVAAEEDMLLLEDSPYRLFTDGERLPALKALDTERRVVHLGSFAKTGFPGARVGFVVADQRVDGEDGSRRPLAVELAKIKSMITVNTSSLSQAVLGGLLLQHGNQLATAVKPAAAHYSRTVRRALTALREHFPEEEACAAGVSWNEPEGGFFLTVRLPFPADEALLRSSAERYGVIWTPMRYFAVGGPDPACDNAIRLSCSYLSEEQVDEGIARLARLIKDRLAKDGRGDGNAA